MGTSANICIKTKTNSIKYAVWMDGGFKTLGVYLLETLLYKKKDFLWLLSKNNEESDIEDKNQEYIYKIDYENSRVDIFYKNKSINSQVISYLQDNRPDLVQLINIKLKKLPIGIQTFSEIIEDNYVYIDKTDIAYDLIDRGKYYFLSRPRRFGKSLFLDTLKNIFEAKQDCFAGLHIYDKWDWSESYPVINITFAKGKVESRAGLDKTIISALEDNKEKLGVECKDSSEVAICFADLIKNTYNKYNQKVVILVDEYDKPILDNIKDTDTAKNIRNGLVNLYSVIKGSDEYLKFVFITGVSKFTKTSIFSGLNNIQDISLDKRYGDICGYTQNDIETTFLPYLKGQDFEKIKVWYNGYNFLQSKMYNPFDILLFIDNGFIFRNYWFNTGTPTFLIELINKNNYFLPNLSNLVVGEKLLDSFDIENIDLEVVLYQAGYLTIDEMIIDEDDYIEYRLKLPNKEVRKSFSDMVIDKIIGTSNSNPQARPIRKALVSGNLEGLEVALKAMFSSIPHNNYTKNNIHEYEGFYASVIYVYLQSLGLDIIGEDVTNRGRIDLTIKLPNRIVIIEFKVDQQEKALKQIKEKKYYEKYQTEGKEIYMVGICFDSRNKNITEFECEAVSS